MSNRGGKRISRSMRGDLVDFDLMDIKRQISRQPKSIEVKARENFIEQRLRRHSKRRAERLVQKSEKTDKKEDLPEQKVTPKKEIVKASEELVNEEKDISEQTLKPRRIIKKKVGDE